MAGTYFYNSDNLNPYFNTPKVISIFKAFPIAYFAAIGFDTATCYINDTKNAEV